jgi:hypothetical protein
LGGALVSAAALGAVLIVVPCAQHWMAREAAFASSRDQWVRLEALTTNADRLREVVREQRRALSHDESQLVTGTTVGLAASTLQELVQRYAQESGVQLDRVDAAGEPSPERAGLVALPLQLQARGDIYGLVAFLSRVQQGEKLLVVDELTLNGGFDGVMTQESATQILSWTLRLHGLFAADAHKTGDDNS